MDDITTNAVDARKQVMVYPSRAPFQAVNPKPTHSITFSVHSLLITKSLPHINAK